MLLELVMSVLLVLDCGSVCSDRCGVCMQIYPMCWENEVKPVWQMHVSIIMVCHVVVTC